MPGGSDPACSGGRSDPLRSPFAASSRSRPTTRCSRCGAAFRLPRPPHLTPNRGEKVAKLFVVAAAFMPDHSQISRTNADKSPLARLSTRRPSLGSRSRVRDFSEIIIPAQIFAGRISNSIISSCCGAICGRFAAALPKPILQRVSPRPSRQRRWGGADGATFADLPSHLLPGVNSIFSRICAAISARSRATRPLGAMPAAREAIVRKAAIRRRRPAFTRRVPMAANDGSGSRFDGEPDTWLSRSERLEQI